MLGLSPMRKAVVRNCTASTLSRGWHQALPHVRCRLKVRCASGNSHTTACRLDIVLLEECD